MNRPYTSDLIKSTFVLVFFLITISTYAQKANTIKDVSKAALTAILDKKQKLLRGRKSCRLYS
ncbi:Uncharacterised protein [Sphingobacterium spiritivorum]|uniref:Uncharacterized protein n=1 Tax=Sphingobacterium spiritivorum TaxID=258 RepID=A0A380CVV8_SPHSI|nr:hypothetical protein [Sphingobacterium spiritivorum]SUJ30565.1 Uncharacterised protein [Sphingobacterium spiritivorum]